MILILFQTSLQLFGKKENVVVNLKINKISKNHSGVQAKDLKFLKPLNSNTEATAILRHHFCKDLEAMVISLRLILFVPCFRGFFDLLISLGHL